MMKKVITVLAVLSLFGVSTAHAHDSEDNDQLAGTVLVAGLAVVTTAFLIAALDRHDEYRPAPRHPQGRPYDSRGNDDPRHYDGRGHDDYQSRDPWHNDSSRYGTRYQGGDRGGYDRDRW